VFTIDTLARRRLKDASFVRYFESFEKLLELAFAISSRPSTVATFRLIKITRFDGFQFNSKLREEKTLSKVFPMMEKQERRNSIVEHNNEQQSERSCICW
jgi:hypothetical protein